MNRLSNLLQGLISQFWRNARTGKTAAGLLPAVGDEHALLDIDELIGRGDLNAAQRALDIVASRRSADVDVAMLRARLALKRGDRQGALTEFERAIALQPALAAAHVELGALYAAVGQLDCARACYETALRFEPDIAELHNNLGVVCLDGGYLDNARNSFERALTLRPDFTAARNNLGRVYRELGKYAAAFEIFAAMPGDFHARVNAGLVLNDLGDYVQARSTLTTCVQEDSWNAGALCGLGAACYGLGLIEEAETYYRMVSERNAKNAAARFALANIALLRGDFAAGWPLYDARMELPKYARRYEQGIPAWDGAPLPGQTLLVYAEQGYGDGLLFARFLPLLAAAAQGTVVFRCQRALVRLLGGGGFEKIVVVEERDSIKADASVALMSVGRLLRIARSQLPGAIPYLFAPVSTAMLWRERLAKDTGVRVGLALAGNPARKHDRNRVPGAEAYAILGYVRGVSYYNLQPGHDVADPARMPLPFIDYSSDLTDFSETAALIANLDLVISVDTSVAHLAGAMGKPVLLLHSGTPDWRWAIAGTDSPWYPTVKVFRRVGTEWETALAEVARAVADFTNGAFINRSASGAQ